MQSRRLWWVGLFAVAMAYVESAVVVYLRKAFGIVSPLRDAMPLPGAYGLIEVGREGATMAMLLSVGWLAGRALQARLGFMTFAFGVWDVAYYAWLWVFIGWPPSLLEWDVLFLIPLPWWGPVIAPMLIAGLLATAGALAVVADERGRAVRFTWRALVVVGLGALLALYVFMADAIAALPGGLEAVISVKPSAFRWPIYAAGLALMGAPIIRAVWPGKGGAIAER
jgi:hypothetical protein